MRLDELEQGLDRYGGNLDRWPDGLRADAEALIARDPKAARVAHHAARLDALLADAMAAAPVDTAMMGRTIAGIRTSAHHEPVLRPTPRLAAWAGVAVVAFLCAGYVVGLAVPATSSSEDTLASLMFGSWQSSSNTDILDAGSVL